MELSKIAIPYKVIRKNTYHPIPGKPIIFAPNHSCFADAPVALQAIQKHSYMLAGTQGLNPLDLLFFRINGTIWVDRKDKDDTAAVKCALEEYLRKGQSILWFPEGTWNVTDNLPILPIKWGIVRVAKKCDAQIIPMNLCYNREEKTVSVKFGKPIEGKNLHDSARAITLLRDAMATLWWEQLCNQKPVHRSEAMLEQLQRQKYEILTEYPPLDIEYEQSVIYTPKTVVDASDVFAHLNHIVPSSYNAFLFGKHTRHCSTKKKQ